MPLLLAEENATNFFPLTLTRATFELRVGALSALERALQLTPDVVLQCRPELAAYLRAKTGLRVNEDIEGEAFPVLPAAEPWDILKQSDHLIAEDFPDWRDSHLNLIDTAMMNGAHIVGSADDVHIGTGSTVQPGCVLDASNGPIILGERVQVKWTQIQGPVFVGNDCVLDGARLRPGVSLGPGCKIGGEISASIFQSRANKAHEGFIGHSWVGRWSNFGALATTSNLKNNYGTIRFRRNAATSLDTGCTFLGSLVGDHTKIGIGQMLTTGSNIGVGCNIFGGGVAPSYVPSFSWGGPASGWQEHKLEPFFQTVHATMARRKIELRPESESVLRDLFERTKPERSIVFGV